MSNDGWGKLPTYKLHHLFTSAVAQRQYSIRRSRILRIRVHPYIKSTVQLSSTILFFCLQFHQLEIHHYHNLYQG